MVEKGLRVLFRDSFQSVKQDKGGLNTRGAERGGSKTRRGEAAEPGAGLVLPSTSASVLADLPFTANPAVR